LQGVMVTMCEMLVKLHQDGHKTDQFSVAIEQRPSKIKLEQSGDDIFLDWNSTVDDSGRLRSCVLCQSEVFRERTFPQITGIVIVLAFAGGVAGLLGLVTTWPMLIVMMTVLIIDIVILILSFNRLVCYKCGTRYSHLNIAPYHQKWDPDRNEQLQRNR
jgi:hypothetical protein